MKRGLGRDLLQTAPRRGETWGRTQHHGTGIARRIRSETYGTRDGKPLGMQDAEPEWLASDFLSVGLGKILNGNGKIHGTGITSTTF